MSASGFPGLFLGVMCWFMSLNRNSSGPISNNGTEMMLSQLMAGGSSGMMLRFVAMRVRRTEIDDSPTVAMGEVGFLMSLWLRNNTHPGMAAAHGPQMPGH